MCIWVMWYLCYTLVYISFLLSGAKHLGLCFLIAMILFSPQARDTFSKLLALISKHNQTICLKFSNNCFNESN